MSTSPRTIPGSSAPTTSSAGCSTPRSRNCAARPAMTAAVVDTHALTLSRGRRLAAGVEVARPLRGRRGGARVVVRACSGHLGSIAPRAGDTDRPEASRFDVCAESSSNPAYQPGTTTAADRSSTPMGSRVHTLSVRRSDRRRRARSRVAARHPRRNDSARGFGEDHLVDPRLTSASLARAADITTTAAPDE